MKQKKLLALIGSICLILVLATLPFMGACAKPTPAPAPTPVPTPAPPAPPAPELPTITWRCQSLFPLVEEMFEPGSGRLSTFGQAVQVFDRIKERTGGKFTVEMYAPNVLFKAKEVPEALKIGAIDASVNAGVYCSGVVPVAYIDNNLFCGTGTREVWENMYFNTDYVKLVRHGYSEHDIYWLGNLDPGIQGMMTTFPVRTLDDLKGRKFGASGASAKWLENAGATPVPVAPAELYTALQRGTIEGITYPYYTLVTYKFMEVVKYIHLPGLKVPASPSIILSLKSYNELPEEYQDIMNEVMLEYIRYAVREIGPGNDEAAFEAFTKAGGTITELSDETYREFQKAELPMWEEYAKVSPDCAKLIEIYKENIGLR